MTQFDASPAPAVADGPQLSPLDSQDALSPRWLIADRFATVVRRLSLPMLRISLGVVFVWFGALKVANVTPVADLVANTVPWIPEAFFVPALGVAEIVLGVALMMGYRLVLVCAALTAHLCGTFLTLLMQPQVAFQSGNPLLLTTEGEFVVKNLVLVSAALVIAARFDRPGQPQDR
jgi:uncharacterized membrane protein YkgB